MMLCCTSHSSVDEELVVVSKPAAEDAKAAYEEQAKPAAPEAQQPQRTASVVEEPKGPDADSSAPPGCEDSKAPIEPVVVPPASPTPTACPYLQAMGAPRAPVAPSAWPRAQADAKKNELAFVRVQANIDELLTQHATAIRELQSALKDNAAFRSGGNGHIAYDDLFLLRFVLSQGAKAEEAVRATLKYREANAELFARAAQGLPHPKGDEISKLSISEMYPHTTNADEPFQIVRAGKSNTKKLMDTYSEDTVVEYLNYSKEEAFLRCDATTRRTRRLVKMVSVIDMHSSRFADNDNRFFKALGRASKDSELFYPQLLSISIGINTPSWLNFIWPLFKRLMPAKSLEKFRLCRARDSTTESAASCPFAQNVFTPDTLVNFLGGAGPSTQILGPIDRPKAM